MNQNMPTEIFSDFDRELTFLKEKDRYRILNSVETSNGAELKWKGKSFINLASNNYLGMSQHFTVKFASILASLKYGTGAGASRLMSGNFALYDELEKQIAEFKQTDAALVFPTGYMANIGTLSAILDSNDLVILDRFCHASLVQGAKLSGAKLWVYPHNDMPALENLLKKAKPAGFSKILVVTESLFSMDGDLTPLPELVRICKRHEALMMLDEAHATGVLGKRGMGACEHFNLASDQIDILMGTLSKAVGSLGGFVAGKKNLIDYLKNKSKPFIYTTGLPPGCLAASIQAIKLLRKSGDFLSRLHSNIHFFYQGLKSSGISIPENQTPIFPVLFGSDKKTLEAANILLKAGIYAPAIRPPTVPENESRLRLSILSTHSKKQLACVIAAVKQAKES
jgi:8-amino-7-oxononanoate synthase